MIAEAETPAPAPSIPRISSLAPEVTVRVAFHPDAPAGQQFTFTTPSGEERHLVVTEETQVTFVLDEEGGATWASTPLTIVKAPPDFQLPGSPTGDSVSFSIARPGHYFIPWVFNFNVNWRSGSADIQSIVSPPFYLINVDQNAIHNGILTLEVDVDYMADTGEFQVTPVMATSSVGSILASQLILINTFPCDLTFNLRTTTSTDVPPPATAAFSDMAIVWGAGTAPSWVSVDPRAIDGLSQVLRISRGTGDTISQLAGFQFAITYEGVTILSPDPILINATIGDGST